MNEEIESMDEFPFWDVIAAFGRMDSGVEKKIIQASKAFGALFKPVLMDKDLKIGTKRKVYQLSQCTLYLIYLYLKPTMEAI